MTRAVMSSFQALLQTQRSSPGAASSDRSLLSSHPTIARGGIFRHLSREVPSQFGVESSNRCSSELAVDD